MIDVDVMFPVLVTEELESLKKFYERVFGFEAVFYDPEFYLHLISPNRAIQLGFLLPQLASQPEFLHSVASTEGFVLSLEVQDAASAFAEAQKMELPMAMELKTEVWGQIHFMIEDPAGFRVDVVQHVEPAGEE